MKSGQKFWSVVAGGARRGVKAWLKLMVVVAPVFTLVKFLQYVGILRVFAEFAAPFMKYFRLPGEAAMALILGNFVNLYASMGVIFALKLPGPQFTVLSLMLLISHSQILETAVFFQIRAKWWLIWFVRLLLSLLAGWGLGALIVREPATAARFVPKQVALHAAVSDWGIGLARNSVTMLVVLVIIFVLLELGRYYGVLGRIQSRVSQFIGFMGYNEDACMPWLAGNVFGVVFGAGLIVESVQTGRLSPKQITLVASFLAICHGLFEDTAIFLVSYPDAFTWSQAGHLFWILVPRMVLAAAVTWVLSLVLREQSVSSLTDAGKSLSGAEAADVASKTDEE